MYQQSMLSPLFARLSELRKDESGQIMPFTAVFSLFLVVVWLTVYNVGVGVTDKVRLQDMADQMAYSQAIVGARAMNLIALNNRTMVANLVSYTASVIMRSHSKFIRDLTLVIYTIFYLLAQLPIPYVQAFLKVVAAIVGLIDLAALAYDTMTFFLALLWRYVLNIQIVFILIPATKLLFTSFATLPVLNIAEYQGSAVFRELSNEEEDPEAGPLWKQFGGRNLITSGFDSLVGGSGSGAFTPSGAGLDIAALALQVVSWASWDNLIELPGSNSDGDGFLNFLNFDSTNAEADASALSFKTTSSKISQERRIQWMVARTYPLSDRKKPIFGFEGSGGGGDVDQGTLDEISQKRQDAQTLQSEASALDSEASSLRAEANALRNEDPPDTAGADAKDAQADAKEAEADAKRAEADALNAEAQAMQDEINGNGEDFVGDVIGSALGSDNQLWGFNRDPLGKLASGGSSALLVMYAVFANLYCLAMHLSPARVSMTFGGETRVGKYTPPFKPGRISQFGSVNNPRTDMIPYIMFTSGTFEKVPDYDEQFEIVGTDFFEVEVEYIDWSPWPSWEREDDISLEVGDAAFSSKLEPPVFQLLEEILPSIHGTLYMDLWEDIPGFNGNAPNIWKGLFHEQNPEYNDFYLGFDLGSIIGFTGQLGIVFSPQGYIELDEKHYATKYSTMFNLAYHYERQIGTDIERRKGKYYVMVGKEYKTMRLLRWLGLLDSGGDLLDGVELVGHNGTGVIFNGNTGDFEQDLGDDPDRNYGSYQAAANVEASREFNPHFFEHMVALAKSEVFYERPTKRTEFPNLFNAFWSARLAPLQTDVADFLSKLGVGADMAKAFTFALTH